MRYGVAECLDRISTEATVRRADVRQAISGVSTGLTELLSPGALEHALEQLPKDLRGLFAGEQRPLTPQPPDPGLDDRLRGMKEDIERLADAVSALALGLHEHPADQPLGRRGAEAAQAVNRIMLTRQS